MKNKKIDLYVDGIKPEDIGKDLGIEIDGYTFNPSIFRKNGAKDYLDYCKKILVKTKDKPVSFEVIADEKESMISQAEILSKLSQSIYVKIPIIFTNGDSTIEVMKFCVEKNIKMNITAIFTLEQILNVLTVIKNTNSILSIFAGRIFDAGVNAIDAMKEINSTVKEKSKCKTLWASPRMSFDYNAAINCKTDIITMQPEQIRKLGKFGYDLNQYSKDTVKQFFTDAQLSEFKIK